MEKSKEKGVGKELGGCELRIMNIMLENFLKMASEVFHYVEISALIFKKRQQINSFFIHF